MLSAPCPKLSGQNQVQSAGPEGNSSETRCSLFRACSFPSGREVAQQRRDMLLSTIRVAEAVERNRGQGQASDVVFKRLV
jgi:hypothetical protein